jgi:hypothetical protein
LLLTGCVFPADEPTGIEVSWRFLEVNDVDGADEFRFRTCEGVGVHGVGFAIVDEGDPGRRGTFSFDCTTGFQTPADFQTEASDAFIPLRSSDYIVDVVARGAHGESAVAHREVDVIAKGLTIESLDLALEPVGWQFELTGLDACTEVSFALRYADPEAHLADPPRDDDDEIVPVLYRTNLFTNRNLSVGGQPTACTPELAGVHVVPNVDVGTYNLEVTLDAQTCAHSVEIPADEVRTLDLANLPCEG